MKVLKFLVAVFAVGTLFTFANCGGSNPPAEPIADKQLRLLTQTWKLTGVTLDGVDQKVNYPNFTLTISGTRGATSFNYKADGRPTSLSPWKASGTWKFGTDPATQITRDPDVTADTLDMTYNVTDPAATLSIQFNFQGPGYTRTGQVKGNWVFTFGL